MTPIETKRLQVRIGAIADGNFGRLSWIALFAKLGATGARAAELALGARVHIAVHSIMSTPLRLAHFMAQLGHESGGFRYMEEIASGQAYEGRADLGNVQAGDGRRYKGRGPIQITGRANYRRFGELAGIDLEGHPEIAAIPSIGLLLACLYWTVHGLNQLADGDDLVGITRRINGGTNGLDDRRRRLIVTKGLML